MFVRNAIKSPLDRNRVILASADRMTFMFVDAVRVCMQTDESFFHCDFSPMHNPTSILLLATYRDMSLFTETYHFNLIIQKNTRFVI